MIARPVTIAMISTVAAPNTESPAHFSWVPKRPIVLARVKAPSVDIPKHAASTPAPGWRQRTSSAAMTSPPVTLSRNAGPITCTDRIPWSQRPRWIATEARTATAAT